MKKKTTVSKPKPKSNKGIAKPLTYPPRVKPSGEKKTE